MGFAGALGRLIALLLVLAGLCFVVGWFLPAEHTIRKTSIFAAAPDEVYDAVTDLERQRDWRSDLKSLTVDSARSPRSWTEEADGYRVRFREVGGEPPKTFEVEFESVIGVRGRLKLELTGTGERTELTSVETISLDNPYLRVGKVLVINFDSYLDRYLSDLGVRISTLKTPAATGSATAAPSATAGGSAGSAAPTAAALPTPTASPTPR